MAFGLSFGKNKSKVDQTTSVDKTETRNESGTSTTTGAKSGQSSSTSQSTGSQSTSGSSQQNTSGATTGTGSQTQTSTSKQFGDEVLGGLNEAVTAILGGLGQQGATAASDSAELGDFNADEFVASGMAGAQGRMRTQMDEALGGLFDAIGGTSGSNSAAALLAQRLEGNAAAELAGVRSQLEGQGQEILRSNIAARAGLTGQGNELLGTLLAALKGGEATTAAAGTTQTSESQQQTQTGTQQQNTQQQQQQQQQTTTLETMLENILKNLTGTSRTQGTEHTKGTTTEKGGGFGLSI